jgi:hypothetical protein
MKRLVETEAGNPVPAGLTPGMSRRKRRKLRNPLAKKLVDSLLTTDKKQV